MFWMLFYATLSTIGAFNQSKLLLLRSLIRNKIYYDDEINMLIVYRSIRSMKLDKQSRNYIKSNILLVQRWNNYKDD